MNAATIRKFLYNFLIGSMIFYITSNIVSGINISGEIVHFLIATLIYVVANQLVRHVIKFLNMPLNPFTFWLTSFVLSFGAFYLISMISPGVIIQQTVIDPVSLGIVSIEPYTLSPELTMAYAALISSLISLAFFWLSRD